MNSNRYDTFIFDLDGTLLDTLTDLADSVNYALRQLGMPEHTIDEVRLMVGNGVHKLMERAVPDGIRNRRFEEAFALFRSYYSKHSSDTTQPYDGIPELLLELKRHECLTAVVSNKFNAATKALCKHFFPSTIDVAIGEHEAEGIRKKPAPDTVIEALRQLQQMPSASKNSLISDGNIHANAVYIGDSDIDILTARNSSLPCISVLWGFRSRQFLLEHGATTLVSHPAEILEYMNNKA